MLNDGFAKEFADAWVCAWNAHDIDAVMAHYADAISFQSPFVVQINNDPNGMITGKEALKEYFLRALSAYPELHFELYKVLVSINSVVLYYKSVKDMLAAEFMELDEQGRVVKVYAHYSK